MSRKLTALKVINATNVHKASVIIFHGSGDTGNGFYDWMKFLIGELNSPHIKYVFPTAPLQPYKPAGGQKSYVWFDRIEIHPYVPDHKESVEAIGSEIKQLINREVENGISLDKIIVGGFSMGGALALQTAYRFVPGLAGVFALSSFLNKDSGVYQSLKSNSSLATVPLYMAHGDQDSMVKHSWGETSYKNLKELGVKGQFHTIKNCMHEIKKEELTDLMDWIDEILPEK